MRAFIAQGPVLSDRTHHSVTSPVLEDFLRVSYFGVSESFMPAPSTGNNLLWNTLYYYHSIAVRSDFFASS